MPLLAVAALREIYSAIKPGGFLLVNEVMGDPHYQSIRKVKDLAQQAGLRPSTIYGNQFAFSVKLEKARRSEAQRSTRAVTVEVIHKDAKEPLEM